MDISKARALEPGQTVRYPSDRGRPAGTGTVVGVGKHENTNIHGVPYVWVGLKQGGVWPSNRLN